MIQFPSARIKRNKFFNISASETSVNACLLVEWNVSFNLLIYLKIRTTNADLISEKIANTTVTQIYK